MLPHARDPAWFRQMAGSHGGAVAVIAFGRTNQDLGLGCGTEVDISRVDLRGVVFFGPLFDGHRQFARWFERTNFGRNPFPGFSCCNGLPTKALADVARRVGVSDGLRWQDVLACAAIPYGAGSVTLVTPPAFEVSRAVRALAASYGKAVRVTSLERFSDAHVQRLKTNYMVAAIFNHEADHTIYDADARQALGEPLNLYLDLVPEQWRTFGLDF